VIPGPNTEALAISKDHSGIVKFESAEDEDFQTICHCLKQMVIKAPLAVTQNWQEYRRHEGK
jgi:hypothetical protein